MPGCFYRAFCISEHSAWRFAIAKTPCDSKTMNEKSPTSKDIILRLEQVLGDYLKESTGDTVYLSRCAFVAFAEKGYKSVFLVNDHLNISQLKPTRTIFSLSKGISQANTGSLGLSKYFIHLWDLESKLTFVLGEEMPNASVRETMQCWFVDMGKVAKVTDGALPLYINDYGSWGGILTTYP